MNDSIYRQQIIEHYKSPLNTGKLDDFDAKAELANYSCGDETTVYLSIKDGKIANIGHNTVGCALAVAGISMLSEELKGKTIEQVEKFDSNDIVKLLGIEVTPSRLKCATLGLEAIKKAIEK